MFLELSKFWKEKWKTICEVKSYDFFFNSCINNLMTQGTSRTEKKKKEKKRKKIKCLIQM